MSTALFLRRPKFSPKHRLACVVWAALLFAVFTSTVSAEIKNILGVPFEVDRLGSTGGGYTLVAINGKEELVEDTRVDSFIYSSYFTNRALFKSLGAGRVNDFLDAALLASNFDAVHLALAGQFEYGDATSDRLLTFIERLAKHPQSVDIFKGLLTEAPLDAASPRILSIAVVRIAEDDIDWIRTNASRLVYGHATDLRAYLRKRIIDSLQAGDTETAAAAATMMSNLFSAEDPEANSFNALVVKMQQLSNGGTVSLADISEQDPVIRRYLVPLFREAIQKRVEEALENKDPERALHTLSTIEPERRTPTTHALTVRSLDALSKESTILVESPEVEQFVLLLSKKDSAVAQSFYGVIERMIAHRTTGERAGEIRSVLQLLTKLRPDPNDLNDGLRIRTALAFAEQGRFDLAEPLLEQVHTGIPVIDKARLLLHHASHSRALIMSVLFILLGSLGALILGRRILRAQDERDRAIEEAQVEEEEDSPKGVFVTAPMRSSAFPSEYLSDLFELGLDSNATLRDIKTTYRSKVKAIHPDSTHDSREGSEQFLRIKALYERILLTRKRLGLD